MNPLFSDSKLLQAVYGHRNLTGEQEVKAFDTEKCGGCRRRGHAILSPGAPRHGMIYGAHCGACEYRWYICSPCFRKFDQVRSHLQQVHNVKATPGDCTNPNIISTRAPRPPIHSHPTPSLLHPTSSIVGPIKRDQSVRYLARSMKGSDANQQLVARAFRLSPDPTTLASQEETAFHLKAAKFVRGLTKGQVCQYSDIVQYAIQFDQKKHTTRVPVTREDIQKHYLTGRFSIANNLCCPQVEVQDGHAFIPLVQSIAHELSTGCDLDMYSFDRDEGAFQVSPHNLNKCMAVDHLLARATQYVKAHEGNWSEEDLDHFFISLREWSDDCEPNATRRNKGSIWVYICGTPTKTRGKYLIFPVALGRKGSHEKIIQMQEEQLEQLREGVIMYDHKRKKHIILHADVLIIAVDRPERSSITQLCHHSGSSNTNTILLIHLLPCIQE
jgi:hypothetical protein